MRKSLSLIHILGGLLFFPVLIIIGLSALHINHHFSFLEAKSEVYETHTRITITDDESKQKLAENIRDSLGLMGWCPYWTQRRDTENFSFSISHNGAEYSISAKLLTGDVIIKRKPRGFGAVMNSLHFFNENLPSGTAIVNTWKYFKDLCFFWLILALTSGIWLFAKNKKHLYPGFALLFCSVAIPSLLMLYIWLAG